MSAAHKSQIPPNAKKVFVYSIDKVLVNTFESQAAVAKWLNISASKLPRYIRSGNRKFKEPCIY